MSMTTNEPPLGAQWIDWHGLDTEHLGGQGHPEAEGTPVFVEFRDGSRSSGSRPVEGWIWTWSQSAADIVRYAVDRGSRHREDEVRFRKVAGQQDHYSPAELRAFNAGRAFAERIARAEQNARRRDLCQMALHGLADDGVSQEAVLHRIVAMIYPDLADLADQDPALARRALNALQPE